MVYEPADERKAARQAGALRAGNAAALLRQPRGFILWGIEDGTGRLVGAGFRPRTCKIGNEELENWLLRLLSPRIEVACHEGDVHGQYVMLIEVQAASHQPIGFSGVEYIRVGSYKKKLKDFPEKERALWAIFSETPFESGIAAVERYQLPAPDFRPTPQHTMAVLYAPRDFVAMDRDARIRAWCQRNGKDWTVEAFMVSDDGGMGLDVAKDNQTRRALLGALARVAIRPLAKLRDKRLEGGGIARG